MTEPTTWERLDRATCNLDGFPTLHAWHLDALTLLVDALIARAVEQAVRGKEAELRAQVTEMHAEAKRHADMPETSQNVDFLPEWQAAEHAYAQVLALLTPDDEATGREEQR